MTYQHPRSGFDSRADVAGVWRGRNGYPGSDLIVVALVRVPIRKDTHQQDDASHEQNGLGDSIHCEQLVC